MDEEKLPLERIVAALPNLDQDALTQLEEVVWNSQQARFSNETLKAGRFSAHIKLPVEPTETLSLEEILQAVPQLNPAEIDILHQVILSQMMGRQSGKQEITASWGSTSHSGIRGMSIAGSSSASGSGDKAPMSPETVELFKSFTELLSQASDAKMNGEREKALELIDQAAKLAEAIHYPKVMIERLRKQYL